MKCPSCGGEVSSQSIVCPYCGRDYEEEFEPLWERVTMYENCKWYRVFSAADEAGLGEVYTRKAEYFEKIMTEVCEDPTYPENQAYGGYFLELSGKQGVGE